MLNFLFISIELVLASVAGLFVLYLLMLSVVALFFRPRREFPAATVRHIAFVIPAHNEEQSIAGTLKSLAGVSYPRDKFDIVVIADNCTDATAEIARTHGVTVFERTDADHRSKGYALRWCFDRLLKEGRHDAYVVIDADTVVEPGFLSVMNYYLGRGSLAIQCSDLVAPQPESWSSEMTRFGFTLYNYVRPLGRRVFGWSAGIRGNGMCFAAETLHRVPWNTYSLNEDLEYGLILLIAGINVDFAPEAKLFATMPTHARNAETQRSRWERGRFPIIRLYAGKLFAQTFARMEYRLMDALIDLVTPPFVNLFAGVIGMLFLSAALALAGVSAAVAFSMWWGFLLAAGLAYVFIGLFAAGADPLLYKAFFNIPRYAFWKLTLYAKAFRRTSSEEWIRTTRDPAVEQKSPVRK